MDVDDMFCSPQYNVPSLTWVQNTSPVMQVDYCSSDKVISASQLTAGIAVLAVKNEQLVIFVYSYPDFDLQFLLDVDKYSPYIGPNTLKVLSMVSLSSLVGYIIIFNTLNDSNYHSRGCVICVRSRLYILGGAK